MSDRFRGWIEFPLQCVLAFPELTVKVKKEMENASEFPSTSDFEEAFTKAKEALVTGEDCFNLNDYGEGFELDDCGIVHLERADLSYGEYDLARSFRCDYFVPYDAGNDSYDEYKKQIVKFRPGILGDEKVMINISDPGNLSVGRINRILNKDPKDKEELICWLRKAIDDVTANNVTSLVDWMRTHSYDEWASEVKKNIVLKKVS